MTVELIKFSLVRGKEGDFPRPYPASREIPDWYKSMSGENEATGMQGKLEQFRTVKNCLPFLDAMTCGYIIPLAVNLKITVHATGFFGEVDPPNLVHMHLAGQVPGAPFENNHVLKFINPWLIQTPPGYSTLFLPPLNRFQLPILPLTGLVDTDRFYQEVNFPTLLTVPPGNTLVLERGTPFVQAIPIKRAEFQSEFVPVDVEKLNEVHEKTKDLPINYNHYKDNCWQKKGYR
jgi:Family of unknown function (DUF6065)